MPELLESLSAAGYEAVIGLEIHVELNTRSKMFCDSAVTFGEPPNTHVCPVCLGLPGSLPVVNKKAVEHTILIGLALNCRIAEFTQFHRKNYFYPDMPKNYQISQYDLPLCVGGSLGVAVDDREAAVGITRVHLEEDTGKLVHVGKGGRIAEAEYSLVDFNRAGTPLAEIVSEPDIRDPAQARAFLQKLRSILLHLGVSDCNMEEGSLRCDANVSIRPIGAAELGTKTEVKNMNSFRGLVRALEFEIGRQLELLLAGERVVQETRHWDAARNITTALRSKEEAHDYRYFADPDLVPMEFTKDQIDELNSRLPELPDARAARLIAKFGLGPYEAAFMTQTKAHGDYFEAVMADFADAKTAGNWIMGELSAHLNAAGLDVEDSPVTPGSLASLLALIGDGTISGKMAKEVFKEMFETGREPEEIIETKGMKQITGQEQVEALVDKVMERNGKAVEEYRAGKKPAFGFLIGQVMAESKGQANPRLVNEILRAKLDG
jgi:aspartyl-tRNA(Asn)/glutamyl-tRNA(Gln) amidotransferase subunit B